jgi:pimeloyl-ACP methyl ester carboxylesterase
MEEFRTFDDTRIVFQRWGPSNGAPPIVLHHGFVVDANLNWVGPGIVDALVRTGRQVVALDARGHGRSEKPHDPDRYGETAMARDLMLLVDRLGVPRVDLVGYSMGAIVSLITATQDARVRRLVVGGVGAAVVELGGVDTRVVPNEMLVGALLADDPSQASPAATGFRMLADAIGGDRLALAAQARSVHCEPIPLGRITAPTLVLAGDADPLAARPEVLAAAIPGASLVAVPGDHQLAVLSPLFSSAILGFLA